jgi:hypothetical protein
MAKIKNIIQDNVDLIDNNADLKTFEALDIKGALDEVANRYSESKATTNAGWFLRLLSKVLKPSTVIKLFAHKLSN